MRIWIAATGILGLALTTQGADRTLTARDYQADFAALCTEVGSTYAYFETKGL